MSHASKLLNLSLSPRILVIRRDNIGDLVCTTPAIAALRQRFPKAEIGALVNSYNAEVLRGNPNIDRLFVYQKLKHAGGLGKRIKALSQRLRLIAQLRRWNPEVTILAKSSYDRHGLNFARQIGAKNIIGFVPDDLAKIKSLPEIQLATPEFTALHEVEAVNLLLAPLGIEDALGSLEVFPDLSVEGGIRQRITDASLRIALHISAREVERRWGLNNFIAFVRHLLQIEPHLQILLFWSPGQANDPHHPGDDEAAAELIGAISSDRLVPMPTKGLPELVAALSLCDVFIGTDGGAMHLAVGLKKKVLAMFENQPGKLNHWYPWRAQSQIVHSQNPKSPTVENVTVEQTLDALKRLLA